MDSVLSVTLLSRVLEQDLSSLRTTASFTKRGISISHVDLSMLEMEARGTGQTSSLNCEALGIVKGI